MKKAILIMLGVLMTLSILLFGGIYLGHKVIFKVPYLGEPSISAVSNDDMSLGNRYYTPTMEEYLDLLAKQLVRYNELAPTLWPDNPLVNQSLYVEDIDSGKFWKIDPAGNIADTTKDEIQKLGMYPNGQFNGHDFYKEGAYLSVSEADLSNYALYQKYLHLGSYDAFITFVHEGFHAIVQSGWTSDKGLTNTERDEFKENAEARAKRMTLQQQLLQAISQPGDTGLILAALSTYEDYKTSFPEDYKNSILSDRSEGTAYYYELISCLYASYPDQVNDKDSLDKALALLATRPDEYTDIGLVVEGYHVGAYAAILLDRLNVDWKKDFGNNPTATPIELLSQHFNGEELPSPHQVIPSDIDAIKVAIKEADGEASPALLFRFLYTIFF